MTREAVEREPSVVCGIDGCDFAVERGEGRTMALHKSEDHTPTPGTKAVEQEPRTELAARSKELTPGERAAQTVLVKAVWKCIVESSSMAVVMSGREVNDAIYAYRSEARSALLAELAEKVRKLPLTDDCGTSRAAVLALLSEPEQEEKS